MVPRPLMTVRELRTSRSAAALALGKEFFCIPLVLLLTMRGASDMYWSEERAQALRCGAQSQLGEWRIGNR
ncbi:hypothetical protein XACLE20_20001 [Xanthomonas citri pv. citri]|nr:hypothetical protein XACLE20_20001 [Xanthomonas citri pv. citri]CEH39614.1 hypothetical protein XACLE3_30001 [Xanthomonas citri pv. citri]